jgi:hypothetical protein
MDLVKIMTLLKKFFPSPNFGTWQVFSSLQKFFQVPKFGLEKNWTPLTH